jgi:hypothetical protein
MESFRRSYLFTLGGKEHGGLLPSVYISDEPFYKKINQSRKVEERSWVVLKCTGAGFQNELGYKLITPRN